ncbi:ATP-dependent DNA helicase RecG [Miniphocaeibacter halophilus]|uniref:ATP-dependent DNA helicase RecG n=1 Tax=Miniphocaeibacter halophilus TaxID=2931922 RepID=A0AC61N1R4_9FIRM|nr:ATP-dependent DNA helicase RecG [Miniphocaeibacter halophilus]QQK07748.1 ATP-dependent DNA helicase RecG [Miniphocaeibacter halophilus]
MKLKEIKGIGPKKEKLLNNLGIFTVKDLIEYYPRKYEDRSKVVNINDVPNGEMGLFYLKIISPCIVSYPRRNMSITKCKATDGTNIINIKWFNNHFIKNSIRLNNTYYIYGKVTRTNKYIEIDSPVVNKTLGGSLGKIYPIYSLTKGLSNNDMNKFVLDALKKLEIKDILPKVILEKFSLLNRKLAIRNIHFPENEKLLILARKTLKFEELLVLQTAINLDTINIKKEGIRFKDFKEVDDFIKGLPFKLTNAQRKVVNEIFKDMNENKSMNRLVQGDVGSGKTIVAAIAMLKAFYNGYQSAMMAPTEILATQHYNSLKELFKNVDLKVELLKGSMSKQEKDSVYERIYNHEIDILIGTHAIIEDKVEFSKIGLVITDEQHRFGVKQRAEISKKGNVDTLIMTATPIPRTLTLAMYGDLDISIIDSLPPGRKNIDTFAVNMNYEKRVINFLKKQIKDGRQGYIVCPLIEESDKLELNSVIELYERLKQEYFQATKIAFIHGKMKNDEKESIMDEFINNNIKILFSTTVIEVGINVPNANIMIIYNAERFGLSQLHQLRGRVGRGQYQSYCILINNSNSKIARERMRIMQNSNDGFEISKKDLELRGSGDILGTKQSGLASLKIANIFDDMNLLNIIQPIAKKIVVERKLDEKEYFNLKKSILEFSDKLKENIIFN